MRAHTLIKFILARAYPCGLLSHHVNDRCQPPLPFVDNAKLQTIIQPSMELFPIVRRTVRLFQDSSDKPSNFLF